MSMLHALAGERSERQVWWIYGARNRANHPFAEESRSLKQLPRGRGYILYSKPAVSDELGEDFDAPGHIGVALLEKIGVPRNGEFYLCGPSLFLENMRDGLRKWGVHVHMEIFGALDGITPHLCRLFRKAGFLPRPSGRV